MKTIMPFGNKPPKEITVGYLNVVLMPNGEVICLGKTVGWIPTIGERNLYVEAPAKPSKGKL